MHPTILDPSFFLKSGPSGLEGVQLTLVDDTCGGRSSEFSLLESKKAEKLNCKDRAATLPLKFNGIWIDGFGVDKLKVHQYYYSDRIP